jgi:hypothetical protein
MIEDDYIKMDSSSFSPVPQDIEIRINNINEKTYYMLKKKEFDLLISFFEQNIPNVLFKLF